MNDNQCKHKELFFGSGGYYVFCRECSRRWVAWKPGAAEYGPGFDGADIGAGGDGMSSEDVRCIPGNVSSTNVSIYCWNAAIDKAARAVQKTIDGMEAHTNDVGIVTGKDFFSTEIAYLQDVLDELKTLKLGDELGLPDKPASPLPWRIGDDQIYDANGDSILGVDEEGFPIGFPCEADADYIVQAVNAYTK